MKNVLFSKYCMRAQKVLGSLSNHDGDTVDNVDLKTMIVCFSFEFRGTLNLHRTKS